MQKYEEAGRKKLKRIIIDNFIGGISWGLGATIGLALVLTLFGFLMKNINVVPVIGEFVSQVAEYVEDRNSSFGEFNR